MATLTGSISTQRSKMIKPKYSMRVLKNKFYDLTMLFDSLGEDQDVINVYTNHPFHDEISENVVHHCLEGRQTIA
ncbi:hypothetical protein M422DRAFT_254583 [Sphaerobolus stellatus SS14]|uniref:Uncharacterized protein n=1 Tax=Sphaerobolus stellatus (strain SS14) TaxID=990650 RepID=A0A0C9V5K3_SPHS4|nr:hypothetical protein M422DRAFT_254583 [Sphaerobolus stellatus SS14]